MGERDLGRERRQVAAAQRLVDEYAPWLCAGWQIVVRVGRTATFEDRGVAHADLERDPANRIAVLTLHPDLPEDLWRGCTLHELLHITTSEVEHDLDLGIGNALSKKDYRRFQRIWDHADERLIETLVRAIEKRHHPDPRMCYDGVRPLDHDEAYTYADDQPQSSSRRAVGFAYPLTASPTHNAKSCAETQRGATLEERNTHAGRV